MCDENGGSEAAAEFFAEWGIEPKVVKEFRVTVLTKPRRIHSAMLRKFSLDRLRKAGLVTDTKDGRVYWLVNDRYPVIEPHLMPDLTVVGLQFRCSKEQAARIKKDAGNYTPKFLSLSGVDPKKSLVGGGLAYISKWSDPDKDSVYIVEGIKDMLAAYSMGVTAYAIPGVAADIPTPALEVLAPFSKVVMLDGDEAGRKNTKEVLKKFKAAGQLNTKFTLIEAGKDVAEICAARSTSA